MDTNSADIISAAPSLTGAALLCADDLSAALPDSPLERLSQRYVLKLYASALGPQRFLRRMLKEKVGLGDVLELDEEALKALSQNELRERVAQRLAFVEGQSPTCPFTAMVEQFGLRFGLSPEESQILLFAVVVNAHRLIDSAIPSDSASVCVDLDQVVSAATGIAASTVKPLLAPHGLLCRSGLIQRVDRNFYEISERLELLDDMADVFNYSRDLAQFEQGWLARAPASELQLGDVGHLQNEIATCVAVLKGALAQHRSGVQILLYGEPGVGKTQLARLIATQAGANSYLLPDVTDRGYPLNPERRLRRYAFLQRLLSHRPGAMLILDEIEDLLASNEQWVRILQGVPPSSAQKAWKNRLLEESKTPGIWIANWIDAIDPALLRRFTLAIRVPAPPARVRVEMLARRASVYADDARLRELISRRADIGPADIERAHRATELSAEHSEHDPATRFLHALAMRADGERAPIIARRRSIPQLPYQLRWLNTDPAVDQLLPLVQTAGAARMAFFGPPGTGKTALAQHLAEQLDRPLHIKKGSDLLSCWVGETEHNIAKAFSAARREDALLLIDEADSFLRQREGMQHGFEVSAVNQLLKELEDYDGLVALCTNFFDTLDSAVLRRLDLKVGFSRLRAAHAQEAFIDAATVLGIEVEAAQAALQTQPLREGEYALGDLAVAIRQARLRSATPNAELLRNSLEAERSARTRQQGRGIGFHA